MDERALFDLFHDALEIEPRPGSYERLRLALTKPPVAVKARPAFRMRWTTMGFRAAAVTAVVIAIALIAGFLAVRQYRPVGNVPAGQDQSVTAYRSMIQSEYQDMAASTSNHCNTIDDTGCEVAVRPVVAALQKWVDHMNSFQTPPRYAVLDMQLRQHLKELIVELNAAVAFQKSNDEKNFRLAVDAALYERGWINPPILFINGYVPDARRPGNSPDEAFNTAKQELSGCLSGQAGINGIGCAKLARHPSSCLGANAEDCQAYVKDAETQMQNLMITLMTKPPSPDQATKFSKLLGYLAEADTALLAITDAILKGDAAKIDAALQSFSGLLLFAAYTS